MKKKKQINKKRKKTKTEKDPIREVAKHRVNRDKEYGIGNPSGSQLKIKPNSKQILVQNSRFI